MRRIVLVSIVVVAAVLSWVFVTYDGKGKYNASFTELFELMGRPVKGVDRALTRSLPVKDIDEEEYGNAIRMRYDLDEQADKKENIYLNELLTTLTANKTKSFNYTAYVLENDFDINACAMPGGVIFVTKGLLDSFRTEGQVASVLAHEVGHIERSHCLDAVRFELLTQKIADIPLGALADLTVQLMMRHAYSKTQEVEADNYSYKLLLSTRYDPSSAGEAFKIISRMEEDDNGTIVPAMIVKDYMKSHPDTKHRKNKFEAEASLWWKTHPSERRYRGGANLVSLQAMTEKEFRDEWITGKGR